MTTDTLREAVARAIEPKCYGLGDTKRLMSLELTDAALSAIEAAGWRVVKAGSEGDWLMSVFDMERILASAPSRKRWDISRHVLTHVQSYAAAPRLDATVRSGEEG